MKLWNKIPFVRFLIPFVFGIIVEIFFPFSSFKNVVVFSFLLFSIISILVLYPKIRLPYHKSWLYGILLYVLLFLFGAQIVFLNTDINFSNHFSYKKNYKNIVLAEITEASIEKENSIKLVIVVKAINRNAIENCNGKAICYLKKDEASENLKFGDRLLLNVSFNEIPSPQNPSEFNYKRFLSFHNINFQCYAKKEQWINLNKNEGNVFYKYALLLRDNFLNILKSYGLKDDEFAVGAALLLGYEDMLEKDVIHAFSASGALHVLSVSGLHVGIIFLVFNWLLAFIDKIKYGKYIKAILLLLLLWFYAAITGLSPSVLRATTMFSFIVIAKVTNRNTSIYNTLAVSAFCLLLYNPYLIMSVGFQLSYLAVIGIVFLQPKIYAWFEFDNKIINAIWSISSVSIAAQIATFPLGLHYFHQFPNYFLLSNLIVIPISTLIIYVGLSVLALAKFTFLAGGLMIAFNYLIFALNQSVRWIENLPFALFESISISIFETWLIYFMIFSLLLFFSIRKYYYLILSLLSIVVLLIFQVHEQYVQLKQNKFIVYNIPKHSAIDFISGKENVLLTDSLLLIDENKLLFHIKHNWWELGIDKSEILLSNTQNNYLKITGNNIQFKNKRIKIINTNYIVNQHQKTKKMKYDFVLIKDNPKVSIEKIVADFSPSLIIFDSSNKKNRIELWKRESILIKQNYYSVQDKGAFVLEI